jgi:hypothetical protein
MKVVPALEGHEPRECVAMPTPWPLSGKVPEGTRARIECEVWRGRFHSGPSCLSVKLV